ncbi:MAG: rhodanese-like domain-containing protein [Cyclobacteriaceae bacterium]
MKSLKNCSPLVIVLFFLLLSCGSSGQVVTQEVTADELKELLKQDILLVDVRTPNEYEQGRIAGSRLVNYRDDDFASKIAQLDTDKPVAVYCAAGGRSTSAMKVFQDAGFKTIYNYKGGFGDWKNRGESIEND